MPATIPFAMLSQGFTAPTETEEKQTQKDIKRYERRGEKQRDVVHASICKEARRPENRGKQGRAARPICRILWFTRLGRRAQRKRR